ncbi:MAG: D-alanyl-D-alanine carboxypeptidase [Ruminococcaceae bacterium]|nr:D-alanyl-D-alanine carboxypeptidase [Oscillospiraceae bacterium]
MKRIACVFMLLVVVISMLSCVSASAVNFDCDVKTYSDSILMVNLDSDMVVFEKDADTKRYPASLTKIMTYIIAAEYFDDYDNTKIKIKKSIITDLETNGIVRSGLEWHVGKSLSVTDLLYALMVPVGHDSATVLADHITNESGTDFVTMMNDKAKELGCTQTQFKNPTGVHHPDHYTTARDMYIITKYAMGLPMFSKICSTATYYLEGDEYPIVTTNYMIDAGRGGDYFYTYATGVKNGTTDEAGRCLVSTAMYEGYAYMVVCLHAPYDYEKEITEQYPMIESANLYRWAFLNLAFVTQATKDTPVCEQKVEHAWDTDSVLLVPESDLNIILPYDFNEADVSIVPDTTEAVSAPIQKGEIVTTATVYYKDQPFTQINLVSQDDVRVSLILYITELVKSVLTSVWFLISVFIVIVLFVVYVAVSSSYQKKKQSQSKRKYK